ncbi:hypothetical protein MiSe_37650 [Microseira wollei NIES-4236]|uniref:Uncharacterized protein n=1 Tax=Microseira wollei NIES-4236 TaxID=2530354 RepID=A0AAV3XAZ4_9CYAN|nr:hypothetical protein MiSe_37650 [Microseira wollei NIES-4236]
MPPTGNPFPRSVILSVIDDLLSHEACSLSHFSNSRIHFGIFPKQNGNLLSHEARSLSHFSNSRIHFGIFPKQNGNLLSHEACSLSHFSNSRILGHIPHHQLSHRQSQSLSLRKPQRSSSKVWAFIHNQIKTTLSKRENSRHIRVSPFASAQFDTRALINRLAYFLQTILLNLHIPKRSILPSTSQKLLVSPLLNQTSLLQN